MHARTTLLALALAAIVATPAAAQVTPGTVPGTFQGPTSSQTPFIVPSSATTGWEVVSLISAGDPANNGYRMVGIPDGLGALAGKFEHGRYVADKSYMTVFMNHEIPAGDGIVRAHGQNGAFVSQWTVHLNTLQVKRGEDLIQDVYTWDTASNQYVFAPTAQFNRFCSADLPAFTAYFNPRTGRGFEGRLFMDGEETSDGRAMAHVVTGHLKGTSYEIPHLGRMAFENVVAHPDAGDKTIVVGLDDTTPGEVYLYVGSKRRTGNPVERAGLVGGKLFGIKVTNGGTNYSGGAVARENNGPINGSFTLVDVSDFTLGSASDLQTKSTDRSITKFARPEDGAWDPNDPRVFYFVVTGANIDGKGQSARLYKLTFNSISNPTGGAIELIIDRASLTPSTPTFAQFDNITVAGDGSVIVEEDPGNTPYLAQIWRVDPRTKTATSIFQADPARFTAPTPPPFNIDEENSGVIDVTNIVQSARWYERGRRYFLADMQAHYLIPGELFEGGQLYLFASPRRPHPHRFGDDDDHSWRRNGDGNDKDDDSDD
jgi:hypothetical protein